MQDVSKFIALTGRVQSYVEQQENGTESNLFPVSCTMYKYDNDIFKCIKYLSVALRGGAGVSVNLDDFKARQPQVDKQYFFYLPEDHSDYNDLTDEQKQRLFILNDPNRSNGNYIIIPVNDSMEENVDVFVSIEQSWKLFIEVIESGNIPVVDLSRLRPKGIDNGKGLTSSGAVSFLTIYEAILNHINKGDLISLMQLCGQMNEVLRRGGCVSGDTWIQTKDGARQVHELVGTKFTAIVNGEYIDSGDEGFWSTGVQDVYELTTTGGQKVKLTENHKMLKKVSKTKSEWTELKNIQVGEYVLLNEHRVVPSWNGKGSFQLGWLIGQVIGDGSVQHRTDGRNDYATVEFYGEYAELQKDTAIRYLEMENLKHPTGDKFTGSKSFNDNGVEKWRVRSSELAKAMAEFGITPESKYVTPEVERYGSTEFYCGLLRGLFDADGTVRNAEQHKDSRCVVLAQTNINTMYAVQRMLLRLGIQSSIYTNSKTYTSGVVAGYDVKQKTPTSQLVITRDNLEVFRDVVGFSMPDKIEKLNALLDSYTQGITECLFEAKVKSIENKGQEEVFDCSIEDVHEFDGNGFRLHNCFKNGIVTFSLIYTHHDIIKYLNVPLADIPGSGKKAIRLDKGVLTNKRLMKLITVRVNDKSLFLMKTVLQGDKKDGTFEYFIGEERETLQNNKELEELYSQVCLTGDTLVLTRDGHYRIDQLIGKDVEVWDGERYVRINNFKQTGSNQEVYQVNIKDGRSIKATAYHKFILQDGTRKHLHELEVGELLKEHYIKVDGFLSTKSAYLKGFLVAEGTSTAGNPLLYIYEPKYSCLSRLVESANETEIGVVKTGAKTTVAIKEDTENNRCILQGLSVRKHELYNWSSVYKQRLPLEEMLNWEDKHKYEFITGVMDGDGTVNNRLKNGNPCYSITSIHLEWLENFQVLLNSVGIKVTISDGTPARVTNFGVNHGGEYACKASYRMVFNTAASQKLGELVTFSRLQNWTKCDPVKSFTKGSYNEIVSIEQVDNSDVYCCGVPTTNAFALSNGILIGQCVEILFKPRSTCLLLHINGGQIEKIEDIVPAFREIAYLGCDLWKRWKNEVGGRASQYLSADEDRQIGIGWIGLANMLAHFGVSYKEFIEAGEISLESGFVSQHSNAPVALKLVAAIYDGYQAAAEIGREAGLERCFTLAPTQSCAFRYQDLDGNTVCKQINPPLDRVVRRTSHTVDNLAGLYRYGNKVETMKSFINDNGVDAVQRLWELFQRLMNTTGMAHCMSFDLYREIDEEWLQDFMLRSPLVTTYYQLADKVDQSYLNKSRANTATSDDEKVACSIENKDFCLSCS